MPELTSWARAGGGGGGAPAFAAALPPASDGCAGGAVVVLQKSFVQVLERAKGRDLQVVGSWMSLPGSHTS